MNGTEDKPMNSYEVATEITTNSKIMGLNDVGKTVLWKLLNLRGSSLGSANTGVMPSAPLLNQYYELVGPGTYTNLLTAPATPLVIPAPADGYVILSPRAYYNGTYWVASYQNVQLPVNKILGWSAASFGTGSQVNYNGKDWTANADTISTDVPGTSNKWVPRLDFYKKVEVDGMGGYTKLSENDFTDALTDTVAFNGGVITTDYPNGRIQVSGGGVQGVFIGPVLTLNAPYRVYIDITIVGGNPVNVLNSYNNVLATITNSGRYIYSFNSLTGGAFAEKVILVNTVASSSFYLNAFRLFQPAAGSPVFANVEDMVAAQDRLTKTEADIIANNPGTLQQANDFSANSTGVSNFNSSNAVVLDTVAKKITSTQASGAKGFFFGPELTAGKTYLLTVTITIIGGVPVNIYRNWANKILTVTTTGTYSIMFTQGAAGGLGNKMVFENSAAGAFECNGISIHLLSTVFANAITGAFRYADNAIVDAMKPASGPLLLGYNSANEDGAGYANTIVGKGARQIATLLANTALTTGHTAVLGELARAVSRSTAVGALAAADAQSSTALGMGAWTNVTHGIAIGRGSSMINPEGGISLGDPGNVNLYVGSCFNHRRPMAPSGIGAGNVVPVNTTIVYHGQDALDQRPISWVSGSTVSKAKQFYLFSGKLFYSKVAGTTSDPVQDSAKWGDYGTYAAPDQPGDSLTADDFNVAGGHAAIAGGRGTGSGVGGKVKIQTAPVSGTAGSNDKNALVDCAEFDASTTTADSTRFLILDLATGTKRRVKIGATDSGGTGKRMLYVDNS